MWFCLGDNSSRYWNDIMIELASKDFKTTVINMFSKLNDLTKTLALWGKKSEDLRNNRYGASRHKYTVLDMKNIHWMRTMAD